LIDPPGALIYLGSAVSTSRCEVAARGLLPFMDKKRIVASAVVFLILATLFYLQYKHWQSFDWGTFWAQTGRIKKLHVLHAIALIYFAYFLRQCAGRFFCSRCAPT
jgi:uncharacterized membrane protein YbhN (UPF0104 family)